MNLNRYVTKLRRVAVIGGIAMAILLFTSEVLARVGGGGSYGGGGGSGGGGGGGGGGAVGFPPVRVLALFWLVKPGNWNFIGILGLSVGVFLVSRAFEKKPGMYF